MKAGLLVKIAFWAAIFVASLWLLISIAFGAVAVLGIIPREYVPGGHTLPEILIVLVLLLQPFLILFLIVRAIRLRHQDSAARRILRALYPLVLATIVVADFGAFEISLLLDRAIESS